MSRQHYEDGSGWGGLVRSKHDPVEQLEAQVEKLQRELSAAYKHGYESAYEDVAGMLKRIEEMKKALDRGIQALEDVASISYLNKNFPSITNRCSEVAAYMKIRRGK